MPHLVDDAPLDPSRRRTGVEILHVFPKRLHGALLPERLPHALGFGEGQSRELHRDFGDVLLVAHDPVGVVQGMPERGMEWIVGSSAQPAYVLLDVGIRGGADHRGVDDQMVEVPLPRLPLELAHGG